MQTLQPPFSSLHPRPWLPNRIVSIQFNSMSLAKITYSSKDNVFSIKPWSGHSSNEELASVCVFTGISHTEKVGYVVNIFKVFIFKFASISFINQKKFSNIENTLFRSIDCPPVPSPLVKSPPYQICLVYLYKIRII